MSNRENLQQISIRVEPIVLDLLNAAVKRHTYWKRNTIINALLKTTLTRFSDRELYDMLRTNWYRESQVDCKYEILNHSND